MVALLTRLAPTVTVSEQFPAMGTLVGVTIVCARHQRIAAGEGIALVRARIASFGVEAWAWGPGALACFNRELAQGGPGIIPPALRPLFERAWRLRQASGGLFEPRIAQLVRLWGFDDFVRLRAEPPPQQDIDLLLAALRCAPAYDGGASYGPAPDTGWDLGAIAKGWIVDQCLDQLAAQGYANACIDAGGNLAVRGGKGRRAWRIGIRDPRADDPQQLLASLEARDEAVITHGDDQRYFIHQGQRYAHVLDPVSGWPVRGLRALTVVHADATLADGGGAALFAAGREGWRLLAERLGITQVLAVNEDGSVDTTPELAARLNAWS